MRNTPYYRNALTQFGVPARTIDAFLQWHFANRWFFAEFERLALRAIAQGVTRWSPDGIGHVVRWNLEVEHRSGEFKVNNDYLAYFARVFVTKYPEHSGFFAFRKIEGLRRAA